VNGDSPLDRRLAKAEVSRWKANTDAIRFFKAYWEADITYQFGGMGGPALRSRALRLLLEVRGAVALFLVRAGFL
jgi:dihydroorotate dehydrogenase